MSGLQMKYFVLKPKGEDKYAEAARKAMRAYSMHIMNENEELAEQLKQWADEEMFKTKKYKKDVEDLEGFGDH